MLYMWIHIIIPFAKNHSIFPFCTSNFWVIFSHLILDRLNFKLQGNLFNKFTSPPLWKLRLQPGNNTSRPGTPRRPTCLSCACTTTGTLPDFLPNPRVATNDPITGTASPLAPYEDSDLPYPPLDLPYPQWTLGGAVAYQYDSEIPGLSRSRHHLRSRFRRSTQRPAWPVALAGDCTL